MGIIVYLASSTLPIFVWAAILLMTRKLQFKIRSLIVTAVLLADLPIFWLAAYYALGLENVHHTPGVGVAFMLPTLVWFIALILGALSLFWIWWRARRNRVTQ